MRRAGNFPVFPFPSSLVILVESSSDSCKTLLRSLHVPRRVVECDGTDQAAERDKDRVRHLCFCWSQKRPQQAVQTIQKPPPGRGMSREVLFCVDGRRPSVRTAQLRSRSTDSAPSVRSPTQVLSNYQLETTAPCPFCLRMDYLPA
jgi:hypothetical protein